jgi:phage gp45-like
MLMEGVVVDTSDPQQMGRVKVWVPAVDGDKYQIKNLPWATFVSPIAGQTRDYPAGTESTETKGLVSYGWWSVPKKGAQVIIGFLYGDSNRRIYMGSYFREHGNRSLPTGRMRPDISPSPLSDTFDEIQPASSNLKAQFSNNLAASESKTRGVFERTVGQDNTNKDGTSGYHADLVNPKTPDGKGQYDPQTVSLTTPGRHALIFQDNPENSRARIKTASGHQIILDDANERIYISTAKGASWIEIDQDGRINVYAADDISIRAGGDMNITAGKNFNVQAGGEVNIQSGAATKIAACAGLNLSGKGVNIESSGSFNILAAGSLIQTGSQIHLNGPQAAKAACPITPPVVPSHEPWVRNASKAKRGKYWKP